MKMSILYILPITLLQVAATAQFYVRHSGPQPDASPAKVVYDSGRDRMVAYLPSGSGGASTWEFDGASWSPVATTQVPPSREEFAMVFDGTRVLLYGGIASGSPAILGDLWAYDGSTWTQLASGAAGPGPRRAPAMAYDALRDRVVLFGGTAPGGNFPSDTWEWDGTAWSLVPFGGGGTPSARVWHRMTFDPVRGVVVLCGGALNPTIFRDTWEFDGTTWVQTVTTGAPQSAFAVLVYDLVAQETLLLGGFNGSLYGEYVYDGSVWTQRPQAAGRYFSAQVGRFGGAYDWIRDRVVMLVDDAQAGVTTAVYAGAGSLTASYDSYSPGCNSGRTETVSLPGRPPQTFPARIPRLEQRVGAQPLRGLTFGIEVDLGDAASIILVTGFSDQVLGGTVPLPIDLGVIGLTPGCALAASAEESFILTPAAGSSLVLLDLPIPTTPSLSGLQFFQQGITLGAQNLPFMLTNACRGTIQ